MKKETFTKGMAVFTACFKDIDITNEKAKIWFKLLESMPDDIFLQAVSSLASSLTNLYPGSNIVGLIKEEAGKIDGSGQSLEGKALVAYDKVERAFREVGVYGSPQFNDKVIHAAIERLGGWIKYCSTPDDELKWWIKDFEKMYKHYDPIRDRLHPSKHLPGLHEQNNTQKFPEKVPAPMLVGDSDKAIVPVEQKQKALIKGKKAIKA